MDDELAEARRARERGDLEDARRRVERVLARRPRDAEAQRLHNEVRRGLGLAAWSDADEADLAQRFCAWPFRRVETRENGDLHHCCTGWLDRPIGNLADGSVADVWNSAAAREIRASILDGSFSHCSRTGCPKILNRMLPYRDQVTDPFEREALAHGTTALERGPREVKLNHDRSCNLSCPSCRAAVIQSSPAELERLAKLTDAVLLPLLADAESVEITGTGDAFASRHFRDLLARIDAETFPGLRIDLYTNGQRFDEASWRKLGLAGLCREAVISVDAACDATYRELRRGGDWERLLRNLAFVSRLRAEGELERVNLVFIVQAANFREMPDFVRLVKRFGFDHACFQMIARWPGTVGFDAKDVGASDHPEHAAFLEVLRDPLLRDAVVFPGTMRLHWEQAMAGA